MANYVMNKVCFKGESESIAAMLKQIANDDGSYGNATGIGTIDFNRVDEEPKELLDSVSGSIQNESVSAIVELSQFTKAFRMCDEAKFKRTVQKYKDQALKVFGLSLEEFVNTGCQYVLNLAKYGAPTWYEWRRCHWGTSANALNCIDDDTEDELMFTTKWTPPIALMAKLSSKYPQIEIYHDWANEDICSCHCGHNVYKCGEIADWLDIDNVEQAIEFSCMLWGLSVEEEKKRINCDDEA